MDILIQKRYMKLPVSRGTSHKTLLFYADGKLILGFTTRLEPAAPQEFHYWDLRGYVGQEFQLEIDPQVDFAPEFTDNIPMEGIYSEPNRPAAHFTSARGWINDPNGAVFYEEKYHMFFQHNPADSCWGNMSWGHAISTDLVHWEQLDDALLPDEMGTMFSGSAFVDSKNVTGLKENEHDPLLLYYTAAGNTSRLSAGQPYTQCMAYSTDGGYTFKKYENNPVVPHIVHENRDPKVVYVPEAEQYYMALFLDDHCYALLCSDDLLHWQLKQRVELPGDGECPDFYSLNTPAGKRYWILAGAGDRYLVGQMQNGSFVPVQEALSLQSRGRSYAAQSFANVPEGKNLRISWNMTEIPNSIFNCSMCTPLEMTLVEDAHGLRLCANPILPRKAPVDCYASPILLTGKAQDICLTLQMQPGSSAKLSLLGLDMDISADRLTVKDTLLALYSKDSAVDLRIITDTHAVEIYVADGRIFTCIDHMADYSQNQLSFKVLNGDAALQSIAVTELPNIW